MASSAATQQGTQTKLAVLHLRKNPTATNNTFLQALEVSVPYTLLDWHHPPEPLDQQTLKNADLKEDQASLDYIERCINFASVSAGRDPRVYIIRTQSSSDEDRVVLAANTGSQMRRCELRIDPRFLGAEEEDKESEKRNRGTFDLIKMILKFKGGENFREWYDLSAADWCACELDEEPWESEANGTVMATDTWAAEDQVEAGDEQ